MTEEPMTVDAMDRETERLRGEKRRAMAALRAGGGRGGDGPGGPAAMESSQPSKESSPPNSRPAGGKCEARGGNTACGCASRGPDLERRRRAIQFKHTGEAPR